MSVRDAVLFEDDGTATPLLHARWKARGALQPMQALAVCLDEDRGPTGYFRGLWRAAFPTLEPLPREPLAEDDGTATDAFWGVFGR